MTSSRDPAAQSRDHQSSGNCHPLVFVSGRQIVEGVMSLSVPAHTRTRTQLSTVIQAFPVKTSRLAAPAPPSKCAYLMQLPQNSNRGHLGGPFSKLEPPSWSLSSSITLLSASSVCVRGVCVCACMCVYMGVGGATPNPPPPLKAPWPISCAAGSCVSITEGHNQLTKCAEPTACPGQQELTSSSCNQVSGRAWGESTCVRARAVLVPMVVGAGRGSSVSVSACRLGQRPSFRHVRS